MPRRPFLTYLLVTVNTAIFVGASLYDINHLLIAEYAVGLSRVLGGRLETVLVAGFIHGGLTHIVYNMTFLLIFGSACERLFGTFRTLTIYVAGLLLGSGFFLLLFPYARAVGASGAVFAVMAAVMLVDPRRPLHPRLPLPLGFIGVAYLLPAAFNAFETGSGIANIAHIGGAVAGGLLAYHWQPEHVSRGIWVVAGFAALLVALGL